MYLKKEPFKTLLPADFHGSLISTYFKTPQKKTGRTYKIRKTCASSNLQYASYFPFREDKALVYTKMMQK